MRICDIPVGNKKCDVCGKNKPYAPMLTDIMWKKVVKFYNISDLSILCLECMEKGLERPFDIKDFAYCSLNLKWGIF